MKKSNIRIFGILIIVCSSFSSAQNLEQKRQAQENSLELETKLEVLDQKKIELIKKLTESRNFVSDYEAFSSQNTKAQKWLKTKQNLYTQIDVFDQKMHNFGNSPGLPINKIKESSMDLSTLLSTLAGIYGGFLTVDGIVGKNKKVVSLGVLVLGSVITVNVAPKFLKTLLDDKLANVTYIENTMPSEIVRLKYQETKFKVLPEIEVNLRKVEEDIDDLKASRVAQE